MTRYVDDLAYVHHTGFSDLARGAARFLVHHLWPPPLHVVDLGCGSGEVLRALSNAGHEVTGVDLSRAMLALARKAAPKARLLHGSLYDVPLPRCDVVLAIGEPLNYTEPGHKPRALAPFFRKVARVLPSGGRFVFDVIVKGPGPLLTRRSFMKGKDWAVLVDTQEDRARAALVRRVTSVVKRGVHYRRTDEVHHLRVLETRSLLRELEHAGFSTRVRTTYGEHALAARRRAFLCVKT